MKAYSLTEVIGWCMAYVFLSVFISSNSFTYLIFSVVYWMVFVMVGIFRESRIPDPSENGVAKSMHRVILENGKVVYIPYATKRSITIMLEYYKPVDVYKWCIRTYHWPMEYSKEVVDGIVTEIKNSKTK